MLARCIVTVALALAATAAVADAQVVRSVYRATPTTDAGEGTTEVERYGGEVLLADVAGLSLMFLGGANDSEGLMQAGLVVAWLAPPAVHLGHSNGGGAVLSLLIRPALVTAGAAAGAAAAQCGDDPEFLCGLGEVAIGALVGYGVAAVVDAGVLARVTHRRGKAAVAPQVAVADGGVRVGLGGTF